MPTYSIYFTNNYSDPGQSQDYAFFCDAPTVTSTAGTVTTYSNTFLTSKLVAGQNWNIDIAKTFYGCTSAIPFPLTVSLHYYRVWYCSQATGSRSRGVTGHGKSRSVGNRQRGWLLVLQSPSRSTELLKTATDINSYVHCGQLERDASLHS
jgi:hypothetical protein